LLLAAKVGPAWIKASALVSATGTCTWPYVREYPGRGLFRGEQVHSASYRSPDPYAGKRVVIVGGGNSGAQILAEVSKVAEMRWVTLERPRFLPDVVDERVHVERATERYRAEREGRKKLTRAMADRDGGLVFDDGGLTVGEYVERWLKDSVRSTVRLSTYEAYEYMTYPHIVPALG